VAPVEWSVLVPDPLREIRCDAVEAPLPASRFGRCSTTTATCASPDGTTPIAWVEARSTPRAAARRGGIDVRRRSGGRRALCRGAHTVEIAARLGAVALGDADLARDHVHLGFPMHPYQEHGALFLARRGRAFLADDMGWERRSRRSSRRC
jgi:hypothetical protein